LCLEWFFFSATIFPKADKGLLTVTNMVIVEMLDKLILRVQVTITAYPMAMRLDKVGFVFDDGIGC